MKTAVFAVLAVFAVSCGSRAAPAAVPDAAITHRDEPEHAELPTRVALAPAVVEAAGIRVAAVQTSVLPETVDVSGDIAVDPDRAAIVTARAPGRIVAVRFKEGDPVTAGSVLAIVDSPELARAQAGQSTAVARAGAARKNVERLARLADKGLTSGQELEAARADAAAFDAEVAATGKILAAFGPTASARVELRTPIAGFVLHRNAVLGQAVAADTEIATVGRFDRAHFRARLFEKDLAGIKVGGKAEVRLNAYPKTVFTGIVESIGKEVDPTARTVLARIGVDDHDDLLKGGLFGTARITSVAAGRQAPRPVVPLAAVTDVADRTVVFVRQPDGDFEMHPVALGRSAGGSVEIVTGVRAGELVVVQGVFTLKGALLKATFGEEE